ncbi:MAG: glycosyltransferase family 39 protein [Myxococcales bacterium]
MAKDPVKEINDAEDQSMAAAVLGKAPLKLLVGDDRRNMIVGALVFAAGVVLAAAGGSSINGSSIASVIGWGGVLVGAVIFLAGLGQKLFPDRSKMTPEERDLATERRDVIGVALFATMIFVPFLGAVGMWDPWEVHYGEVARTMVVKRDFVFPFWENAYFFSKPPLTMWLQGLGIALTGSTAADNGNGPLGLYLEWGMRLPFALLSVLAVSMITLSIGRVFNRRAGLIAGVATATSPLFFMLARQAVTDTPFVTIMAAGMSCILVAEFHPRTRGELLEDTVRIPYLVSNGRKLVLYGFGVGTIVMIVLAATGNLTPALQQFATWASNTILKIYNLWYVLGLLVMVAAGGAAAASVVAFFVWLLRSNGGRERSHSATIWWVWAYVFFGFATLAKGLLGFALPGLILLLYLLVSWDWRLLRRSRLQYVVVFLAIAAPWIVTLSLFGVLPGASAGGLDDESKTFAYRFFIHDHFNRLTAGVHTTTPGGTFTYFIEQLGFAMWPWVALVPGAMVAIGRLSPKDPEPKNRAALLVTIWTAVAFFVFSMSATKFHHYCFPVVPPLAILCALFAERVWKEGIESFAVPVLLGLGFFAVIAQNMWLEPKVLPNMFIYQYERTYPMREAGEQARQVFAVLFIGGGLWLALAYIWRAKAMLVGTFAAVALLFAGYISWVHWEKLTPHWTQRELVWTYYHERGSPNEPIIAYYMNWRGETFYTSNTIRQIKDNAHWDDVVAQPGRFWVLVEQSRFAGMKSSVEAKGRKVKIEDKTCNKFYLASVN